MRKYSTLISIITLILGFAFYGEKVSFNIHGTHYIVAAEVVCFAFWALFMAISLFSNLKKFLSSRGEQE